MSLNKYYTGKRLILSLSNCLMYFLYNKYIVEFVLKLGGQTTKNIDKGSVEYLGPYGLEKGLLALSNSIGNLSTGVVTTYALYILIGLIFYISLIYFSYNDNNLLILVIFTLFALLNSNNNKLSS